MRVEFVKGATFGEWWARSRQEKWAGLKTALFGLIAGFILLVVMGAVTVNAKSYLRGWNEERKFSSLTAQQLQRQVDGSPGTDYPYRFTFEACQDRQDERTNPGPGIGFSLLRCVGNVRAIASDDRMLGRGNTVILVEQTGREIAVFVEYGSLREEVDRSKLSGP